TDGEIDLGMVRKTAVTKPLKSVGSWEYGYRLFIPKKMRAKLSGKLKIDELASLPLAVMEGEGQFRRQLTALAKDQAVDLDLRLECSSYSQIAAAVQSRAYCGFLPQFASKYLDEESFSSFEVSGFEGLRRELAIAWNPKKEQLRPIVGRVVTLFRKS
ncbi:MAG: LysR family transcriptional regulator substrate-binding protein, partial [Verrucomicrobiae bacterium]|nr:LysR family transcriptional regulator substrate-binding protein [Verrucomicrobiae bacterium]